MRKKFNSKKAIAVTVALIILSILMYISYQVLIGGFDKRYDYTGFKQVSLNEEYQCKIPEEWDVGYVDGVLCIYEEIDGEKTIYFVEAIPMISVHDEYNHPFLGIIRGDGDWTSGNNNISHFIYGEYRLENDEIKNFYIIRFNSFEFILISYELADMEINTKIYQSYRFLD